MTKLKWLITEDWTGAINYYRNLPLIRLNTDTRDQISTRTLLIIGNMDPIVTIESVVQSSEYVEKFNVKVISEAQHFPHQQKPDTVNEAILKFFMGKSFYKLLQILSYAMNKSCSRCDKSCRKTIIQKHYVFMVWISW